MARMRTYMLGDGLSKAGGRVITSGPLWPAHCRLELDRQSGQEKAGGQQRWSPRETCTLGGWTRAPGSCMMTGAGTPAPFPIAPTAVCCAQSGLSSPILIKLGGPHAMNLSSSLLSSTPPE